MRPVLGAIVKTPTLTEGQLVLDGRCGAGYRVWSYIEPHEHLKGMHWMRHHSIPENRYWGEVSRVLTDEEEALWRLTGKEP